jgi:thioredoxin reductase
MDFDVIVIGGGVAGLAAALVLGRSRRAVLVVDDDNPRNAPSDGVHNYLGSEGVSPRELRTRGREEVARYGVTLAACRVTGAARISDGFSVSLADGRRFSTRRLLVATGLTDELPDIPGLAARWGRDVLHCPYCHGWEVRDRRIGVLATGPLAVLQAQLFRQLSDRVTLFHHTGPDFSAEERAGLAAREIEVVAGTVEGVELTEDRLTGLRLAGDRMVPLDALVVAPRLGAHDEVLAELGLAAAEQEVAGHVLWTAVPADRDGSTSIPGVWVAGNVADAQATVAASASGVTAAGALNADLVAEDVRHAVAAAR